VVRAVDEQVVVIVGASSGIGRASALAFAARGARVVCAARSVQALDDLVEEITGAGGTAAAVPTDIADAGAVRALAAAAEDRFGRIDTWINSAAVSVWGRVEDITDEEFDRVLRVNFLGHVHGVHAALPALRRAGGGGIIGISSLEGVRAVPLHGPYTASKWALRALYDTLRMELAQEGEPIAVSTILPAGIDTPFFEHARSKIGAMPKPPPPVYAPELVADTIVHTAEHPRREVAVGGAAIGFVTGQRLSPALTDALMSIPRIGIGMSKADRPDNGTDNVDAPMDGTGRVHGSHPGRVLRHSAVTEWLRQVPRPGELLMGALAAGRRRRSNGSAAPGERAAGPSPAAEGSPSPEPQHPGSAPSSARTAARNPADSATPAEGPADAAGPTARPEPAAAGRRRRPASVDTAPSVRDQPSSSAQGADTGAAHAGSEPTAPPGS
jgi:NAD(P)-dependent dehydrogenase (short-subunit alcohol dehydrogenase family)